MNNIAVFFCLRHSIFNRFASSLVTDIAYRYIFHLLSAFGYYSFWSSLFTNLISIIFLGVCDLFTVFCHYSLFVFFSRTNDKQQQQKIGNFIKFETAEENKKWEAIKWRNENCVGLVESVCNWYFVPLCFLYSFWNRFTVYCHRADEPTNSKADFILLFVRFFFIHNTFITNRVI